MEIHKVLGHPRVTRLSHFVKAKNLPFSVEDFKKVCSNCRICAEIKPRFFRKPVETLVKSMHPWERLNVDFKGPLPGKNKYVLLVVDEFSRFPFAFSCKGMNSTTVLCQLCSTSSDYHFMFIVIVVQVLFPGK